MTKIKENDIESVELLVGGTPCQSFSRAGLQGGLQDPRGNLALRFMQIASVARPKWVVWENVPGAMQTNSGRDFGAILGALADLGYGIAYRILDAADFGVPQRRRRVFVVGCLGDWDAPARVLCLDEGGGGDSPAAVGEGPVPPEGRGGDRGPGGGEWWDGSPVTQTLDAVLYKKQCLPEKNRFPAVMVPAWVKCDCCEDFVCQIHGCHAFECQCGPIEEWAEVDADPYGPCLLRYITPLEAERLMGFPDDYTNITYRKKPASDGPRYKALGNSMAVPCMHWMGLRIGRAFNTLPDKETK
jgi:DNA (cytosine-5)-methyltransferase 1